MSLYLGEAVRIRAAALDPKTKKPLEPAPNSGHVDFWAPGKNPAKNPEDRDPVDYGPVSMTYRTEEDDFILILPTVGDPWVAGRWTYRVTLVGDLFENWEYGTVTIKP